MSFTENNNDRIITPWSSSGTRKCKKCLLERPFESFSMKQSSKGREYRCWTCYPCQYKISKSRQTVESRQAARDYSKEWFKRNRNYARYKAYRHIDIARYGGETVTLEISKFLMEQPCFYCGLAPSSGLDRIDSAKGHSADNVRPCCEKCNFLLVDLPNEAKVCLVDGLTKIQQEGYIINWQIPTKRK